MGTFKPTGKHVATSPQDKFFNDDGRSDHENQGFVGSAVGTTPPPARLPATPVKRRLMKNTGSPLFPLKNEMTDLGDTADPIQNLVFDVQKLHKLLEQRDNAMANLEIEKQDQQQTIELLSKQIRQKQEAEERLKEEIWDLELNKQELSQQLSDLQEEQEKTLADQARMTRHQTELLRELEYMKSQQTQWSQTLESLQQNHQEEISHVRKSLCHLQDENESLSKRLSQMLESESQPRPPSIQPSASELLDKSTVTHLEMSSGERQHEELQLDSQPSSPRQCSLMKQPSVEVQSLEIEQLKASLSEATYRLETMQRQLEDEREERMEIHKLLQEAQDQIQHFRQSSLWSPSSPSEGDGSRYVNNEGIHSHLASPKDVTFERHRPLIHLRPARQPKHKGPSLGDELSFARLKPASAKNEQIDENGPSLPREGLAGSMPESDKNEQMNSRSPSPQHSELPKAKPVEATDVLTSNIRSDAAGKVTSSDPTLMVGIQPASSHVLHVDRSTSPIHQEPLPQSFTCNTLESVTNIETTNVAGNEHVQPPAGDYGSLLVAPTSYIYESHRNKDGKQQNSKDAYLKKENINFLATSHSPAMHGQDNVLYTVMQTMMGSWMWKYRRQSLLKRSGGKKHQRFFWIHPYNKMIYWSQQENGMQSTIRATVKSGYMMSFEMEKDDDLEHIPSLHIKLQDRELKLRCIEPTVHEQWFTALNYLLPDTRSKETLEPGVKLKNGNGARDQNQLYRLLQQHPPTASAPKLKIDVTDG